MDIKAALIGVCLIVSGYLFYVNQQRADALIDLSTRYQAALVQGSGAPSGDTELMNAIREQVKAELATNPPAQGACADGKMANQDFARLQELQIQTAALEKKFNQALAMLMDGGGVDSKEDLIAVKATKIKDKILALCKK